MATMQGQNSNISQFERWASLAGGVVLGLYGFTRRSFGGLLLGATGGWLVYRGATGHCPVYQALGISHADASAPSGASGVLSLATPIHVERTIAIDKTPEDVYCTWREFENLPHFMNHLESVAKTGPGRSHWVAKAPLGTRVEWDAEVINDQENRLIAWRSLGDSAVSNAGMVRFEPLDGGARTELHVRLEYNPPAGVIGATFARLFGQEPAQQVDADLKRFKEMLEAGDLPVEPRRPADQPKIGDEFAKDRAAALDETRSRSTVQQASEESFPASDPPSWTARGDDPPAT